MAKGVRFTGTLTCEVKATVHVGSSFDTGVNTEIMSSNGFVRVDEVTVRMHCDSKSRARRRHVSNGGKRARRSIYRQFVKPLEPVNIGHVSALSRWGSSGWICSDERCLRPCRQSQTSIGCKHPAGLHDIFRHATTARDVRVVSGRIDGQAKPARAAGHRPNRLQRS
jgi:hypothetical protein